MDLDWQFKSSSLHFHRSKSTLRDLTQHFLLLPENFLVGLIGRVDLSDYLSKIHSKCQRLEIWDDTDLISVLCFYPNLNTGDAFISHVSTLPQYQNQGLASKLVKSLISSHEFKKISLEVLATNENAKELYRSLGFKKSKEENGIIMLSFVSDEKEP